MTFDRINRLNKQMKTCRAFPISIQAYFSLDFDQQHKSWVGSLRSSAPIGPHKNELTPLYIYNCDISPKRFHTTPFP